MAEQKQPLSLRLSVNAIEQLKSRAYTVSGTPSGIARDLILTGLAGGDNKQLADRLMKIERQLAASHQFHCRADKALEELALSTSNLVTMFDALLAALTQSSDQPKEHHYAQY